MENRAFRLRFALFLALVTIFWLFAVHSCDLADPFLRHLGRWKYCNTKLILGKLFLGFAWYVETLGFLAVFIEAMIGAPQFLKNYQNKSTLGMSGENIARYIQSDSYFSTYGVNVDVWRLLQNDVLHLELRAAAVLDLRTHSNWSWRFHSGASLVLQYSKIHNFLFETAPGCIRAQTKYIACPILSNFFKDISNFCQSLCLFFQDKNQFTCNTYSVFL